MVTNKKFTLPHPNNSTLTNTTNKKNSPLLNCKPDNNNRNPENL